MLIRLFTGAMIGIGATPALAHVTLERSETMVGSSYKAVLKVPHGCNGVATTRLKVAIPEGVIAVRPMPKPGWRLDIVKGAYSRTYEFMHGAKVSEGVTQIVWTGSLEDFHYDEFVFTGFVADALSPDTALYFPVIQECGEKLARWTETPGADQDAASLKSPAPVLRLVASMQHHARSQQSNGIVVESPWARATPGGATIAAGYLSVTNKGDAADRLISASIEGAARVEIHEMATVDGVMRMRPLNDGTEIKPGQTLTLAPGGVHVMFMGLTRAFKAGETVQGELRFEKAGAVRVQFKIAPIGASGPSAGGHVH